MEEFGEDHLEPAAGLGIEAEVVVSAAQVLNERMPATDLSSRSAAALHPRHPRPRRHVHHRDLRQSLDRGETQSPRGRLPGHRHQRPTRMQPGPQPSELARQPLNSRPDYAQRSPAESATTRPGRPALRITRHCALGGVISPLLATSTCTSSIEPGQKTSTGAGALCRRRCGDVSITGAGRGRAGAADRPVGRARVGAQARQDPHRAPGRRRRGAGLPGLAQPAGARVDSPLGI